MRRFFIKDLDEALFFQLGAGAGDDKITVMAFFNAERDMNVEAEHVWIIQQNVIPEISNRGSNLDLIPDKNFRE